MKSHLTEVREMIEAGLRAHPPAGEPHPEQPEPVEVVEHAEAGFREVERSGNVITRAELLEVSILTPVEPCPWCCPTTCLNCGMENCADRLAGTPDVD